MESHALHGDGIYYEASSTAGSPAGDAAWVNLFVPSTAELTRIGASLKMDTGFPDGDTATITLTVPTPKAFTLNLRRPGWAGDGFAVKVNGTSVELPSAASLRAGSAGGHNVGGDPVVQPSSFVELTRTWKTGDTIEVSLPKSLRLEPTPDDKKVAAIMWGPLVLAGDLGPRRQPRRGADAPDTQQPAPVIVAADRPVAEWVKPAVSRAGDFQALQVARVPAQPATLADVSLIPFYRLHRRSYSVYFDVLTAADFDARVAVIAAERERVRKLEAATVGFVQPGDVQPERDFNYQSDPPDRQVVRTNGRVNRGGTGWFSFDLPVDATSEMALVVTYLNPVGQPPAGGNFELQVDGTSLARFAPNTTATGFYDAQYLVPATLVRGKTKITVRFQAATPGRIAPVFGVRMIRAAAVR
jgi:hypothetical protein